MFLELGEALACPLCGPPTRLVVLVDRLEHRRVLEGSLGCPLCERRYPIRGGDADFTCGRPPEEGTRNEENPAAGGEERAVTVAALLGVTDGRGYLLLGEGLDHLAARVSALSGGAEMVALVGPDAAAEAGRQEWAEPAIPVSRLRVGAGDVLPVLPGRMRGAALLAPSPERVRGVTDAVAAGGRLVILEPGPPVLRVVRESPLQVLAEEAAAMVALVATPREPV